MIDKISAPEHYTYADIEPKDAIRSWNLNFFLGNVVKYIVRAGRKEGNTILDDLRKARQYLDFEIEFLEKDSEQKMPQSVTQRRGILMTNDPHSAITADDMREGYEWDDGR